MVLCCRMHAFLPVIIENLVGTFTCLLIFGLRHDFFRAKHFCVDSQVRLSADFHAHGWATVAKPSPGCPMHYAATFRPESSTQQKCNGTEPDPALRESVPGSGDVLAPVGLETLSRSAGSGSLGFSSGVLPMKAVRLSASLLACLLA